MERVRRHIQAIALAMLLALLGMQAAQAVHAQDHDPVLEQVENCIACHVAAHANTTEDPASLDTPIFISVKISPLPQSIDAPLLPAVRPPGRAPPASLII